MKEISTIGLDLAKSVFQVHGVGSEAQVIVRRQLRRGAVLSFFARLAPRLVGMEACSGAHHWARAIAALGHEVKLIPPIYVKPYVKRGKTDAADAAAICEAVGRPTAARLALTALVEQIGRLTQEVETLQRQFVAEVRRDNDMRRLTAIPGVGPISAAAIKALVPDIAGFTSARRFAPC